MKKDKAIICDIDGTLAIRGNRGPFDYSKVKLDKPNKILIRILESLRDNMDYEHILIIVSGRENIDNCEKDTREWMHENGLYPNLLLMREKGDHRSDVIVKKEMYKKHIEPYFKVELVFDDRNKVVRMWRKTLGLKCFQVDYGNF